MVRTVFLLMTFLDVYDNRVYIRFNKNKNEDHETITFCAKRTVYYLITVYGL